jgi:hypothetical protein
MPQNETNELLREIRQLLEEQRPKKRPWWKSGKLWSVLLAVALLSALSFEDERTRNADFVAWTGDVVRIIPPVPTEYNFHSVYDELFCERGGGSAVFATDFSEELHRRIKALDERNYHPARVEALFHVSMFRNREELDFAPVLVPSASEKKWDHESIVAGYLDTSGSITLKILYIDPSFSTQPPPLCDKSSSLLNLSRITAEESTLEVADQTLRLGSFLQNGNEVVVTIEVLPPPGPERLLSNLERVYSLFF